MLGAYLTYGEQYKDKFNAKLNVFNSFFFFCHGKTIQAPIVGDLFFFLIVLFITQLSSL